MAFVEYAQVLHFPILHYHPKYLRIPFANIDQLDRRGFFLLFRQWERRPHLPVTNYYLSPRFIINHFFSQAD